MAHSYFCPDCGAALDPGERCTCPGFIIKARPQKENASVAGTTEARGANAPAEKSIKSIAQTKGKSNIKYYNEGYKSCIDEAADQKALIDWCKAMSGKYPELDLMYHIPNEGKRTKTFAALLIELGLKKGVPDLCLPVPRGKWHGLYIEMKAAGGKPTVEQNQWLCKLRAQGYRCIVAWSFDYAKDFIEWYINIKENDNEMA
jgi:hypothetical protein